MNERSTVQLIGDTVAQALGLFRKEIDLARAEVSENVNRAAVGIGMIAVAAVLALVALNLLAAALIDALVAWGLSELTAMLVVGGALLVIALILLKIGSGRLKTASLAPTRSMAQMRQSFKGPEGRS